MFQTMQPVSGPIAPGQYGGQQIAGPTAYIPAQENGMTQMMNMMMPMMMMFLMIGLIMPMIKPAPTK